MCGAAIGDLHCTETNGIWNFSWSDEDRWDTSHGKINLLLFSPMSRALLLLASYDSYSFELL